MHKKVNALFLCLYGCLFLGGIAALLGFFSNGSHDQAITSFTNTIDPIVDILIFIGAISLYKKIAPSNKKVVLLFIFSSIFLFLCDSSFFTAVYLGKISKINAISILAVPFLLWAVSLISFYIMIIKQRVLNTHYLLIFFLVCFIKDITIIVLYFSSAGPALKLFSFQGIYQVSSATLVLFLFDLAILCLIYSNLRSIQYFLAGNILIFAGDTWLKYAYVTRNMHILPIGDLFWLLGLVTTCFGVYLILTERAYNIDHWFRKTSSIKTRLVFCTFGITLISFAIFLILESMFSIINKEIFVGLPFFFMTYTAILVIVAIFIGKTFEAPFKKIEHNIRALMFDDDKTRVDNDFSTEEFIFLQKFLLDAYEYKEAKDFAQKRLGVLAAQVAHDIRSPLAALDVIAKHLPEVNESKRILIRDALNHIRDITNNLEKTGHEHNNSGKHSVTQIAVLLDYVLSERRIAFSNQSLTIEYNFDPTCYGLFVDIIPSEMKRVISNILNNACEAVPSDKGIVNVNVMHENNHVIIEISDNGPGIPQNVISSLFTNGFTTKSTGSGLGLFHAKETLIKWDGGITLLPGHEKGTIARITLPLHNPPLWFINEISLPHGSTVICVDDSISIYQAWQEKFKAINNTSIGLRYCSSKEDLISEMAQQNSKPCTYLVDYEFSGQPYTGLDLIEYILEKNIPDNQIFLVTSRSAEKELQQFCEKHHIFMIPKFFAFHIPIKVIFNSNNIS